MAKNPPWTDEENDCIVANYFAMLIEEINNREINKSEYRRKLQKRIARSNGAIEFKNRNISYLLNFAFGLRYIAGYLPAGHHQSTLLQAIERWVAVHGLPQENILQSDHLEGSEVLPIVPPPIHRNRPPDGDIEFVWKIAQKYDIAGRDQRNRALGKLGEKRVLGHEKAVLRTSGRSDLAGRVQWISEEVGDGAGYDIASFDREGRERLIEVIDEMKKTSLDFYTAVRSGYWQSRVAAIRNGKISTEVPGDDEDEAPDDNNSVDAGKKNPAAQRTSARGKKPVMVAPTTNRIKDPAIGKASRPIAAAVH